MSFDLPVLGGEPRERSDAVRNRAVILAAAERLFRERGVENTSMDCIAEHAGVGKGTLFRRFGEQSLCCLAIDRLAADLEHDGHGQR